MRTCRTQCVTTSEVRANHNTVPKYSLLLIRRWLMYLLSKHTLFWACNPEMYDSITESSRFWPEEVRQQQKQLETQQHFSCLCMSLVDCTAEPQCLYFLVKSVCNVVTSVHIDDIWNASKTVHYIWLEGSYHALEWTKMMQVKRAAMFRVA